MFNIKTKAALLAVLTNFLLAGCGGSGGGGGSVTTVPGTTFSIGGTLSGMSAGTSIVLSEDGVDNLTVSANGTFTFVGKLLAGALYHVTIVTNPVGQICSIGGTAYGTMPSANVTGVVVTCHASTAVVTTFAGTAGVLGSANGTGSAASFNAPLDVAVDASGNIYVADSTNGTIRKMTPAGLVTTLAGTAGIAGSADGSGAAASFRFPSGIAVDSAGNVYVVDSGNNTIRKITPAGSVTTLAGTPGVVGSTDGVGAAAKFNVPAGIAVDAAGMVYVSDRGNNTIRKITPAGTVTTFAGIAGVSGAADGAGTVATFYAPIGLAVDASGNVYVGDGANSIRKITPAGVVTTLAGVGSVIGAADGTGGAASFNSIGGVAVDAAGNVYVADQGNALVRKISAAGVVTVLAGLSGTTGSADGIGGVASFKNPSGIAVDTTGNIYVADYGNGTVRKIVE